MNWIESMRNAISYIEENLTNDLSIENIADESFVSSFYFQKGFSMLCGYTVGEYIRNRKLTLAGTELVSTDGKIIDIALKYGYDSPDSFTKAFTRFHGVTPSAVRKDGAKLKSFAPLKIKFSLEGGTIMQYKIEEKSKFTVLGVSRNVNMENAGTEIPKFWTEHYQKGDGKYVCGMYGICYDGINKGDKNFEYLIADNYNPQEEIPEGFVTKTIPAQTWAVFPCKGPMPAAIQQVNQKIYGEWLPNCKDYELAGEYNIEMYTDISKYDGGNQAPEYYTEIWIPVKKR